MSQHDSPFPWPWKVVTKLRKALASAHSKISATEAEVKRLKKQISRPRAKILAGGRRRSVQKARLCNPLPKGVALDKGVTKKKFRRLSWTWGAPCGLSPAEIIKIEKQLQCAPHREVNRAVIASRGAKREMALAIQYIFNLLQNKPAWLDDVLDRTHISG